LVVGEIGMGVDSGAEAVLDNGNRMAEIERRLEVADMDNVVVLA
jgi:hypothetical protein